MVPTKKHTILLTRLMAIFVLTANSGFSAVLQRCTMQDADCCGRRSTHLSCRDALPREVAVEVHGSGSCYATSFAGGLTTAPAVLQNDKVVAHNPVKEVLHLSDLSMSSTLLSDHRSPSISIPQSRPSPTSVEKYVLHAAFLI
jgi:hypothetical protein